MSRQPSWRARVISTHIGFHFGTRSAEHFSNLAEGDANFWTTHSREEIAAYMKTVRSSDDDFNPQSILTGLTIPVLWAFGGKDNVMPTDLSMARLKDLTESGHPNFEYRLYPQLGHELLAPHFGSNGIDVSRPYQDMVSWAKTVAARAAE